MRLRARQAGAGEHDAIGLATDLHSGERAAAADEADEEVADALERRLADRFADQSAEEITDGSGKQGRVHGDRFAVVEAAGIRDVVKNGRVNAEIGGEALAVCGFVEIGDVVEERLAGAERHSFRR